MSDVAPEPTEPPVAHARIVYLGPVAPHWRIDNDFGERSVTQESMPLSHAAPPCPHPGSEILRP